eukprot:7663169-Pyramimonas_sp.AAC.1
MLADTKGVLLDERIVAATVHAWFKSGFVAVSAHLHANGELGAEEHAAAHNVSSVLASPVGDFNGWSAGGAVCAHMHPEHA